MRMEFETALDVGKMATRAKSLTWADHAADEDGGEADELWGLAGGQIAMQEMQCGECITESPETMNYVGESRSLEEAAPPVLCASVSQAGYPQAAAEVRLVSQSSKKFDSRRDLNTEQLMHNTFLERKSAQDIVSKGRLFANYAQSSPSSLDGRGRDQTHEQREVRTLLKYTKSLFPDGTGIRRCPFSVNGDCNGRHCEPFWKPILKQEVRKTQLCGEDCKFCHDPRHFPDDEWVKLHVHRTPAARRRAAKRHATNSGHIA